ncbi:hypothetical protein LAV_00145 [Sphingobium phage Lacusarx]|uniref:YspA cpYpsA-related SLOG domain-containing protein n=1 Tax=Sphingobium phage Lacusarx TaxID=1980139 RepID=A0A1W6DWY6_9CAUD|nr:GTP-binding domain [Sphingobium phage Lacusarx]ARK07520.1 hypothetical protein LAV_00145 [Sphingobium phage Lacusarx]
MALSKRRVRVCVTGGRAYKDWRFVWRSINQFERDHDVEIEELGQGEATGVDRFAKEWAQAAGVPTRDYKADWDRHGEAAGGIRNEEMLIDFKPDYLLVFPGGTGTTNCTRHARKMKIERVFFNEEALAIDPLKWG